MKKIVMICLVAVMGLTISCSKDDDNNNDKNFVVSLSIEVNGTLSNTPMLEYRDEDGIIKAEALTANWNKDFNVTAQNFDLLLKATGTVEGEVIISASGSGSGNNFSDIRNANFSGTAGDFDLEISTRLD